jgi:flagellar M-ring protein FliF
MWALIERWEPLLRKHRVFIAVLGLALVVAIGIAVALQRDTRVTLFAEPLDIDQVNEVVTQLVAWNVPFIATPDNVRVEEARHGDLLLRLSLVGIPHTHITTSHEALAAIGPLTPQSVLDAQQLAGLAGDLALSVRGITGVTDARVIIAPAKPALFADDAGHDASASVRLTLQTGVRLSAEQIKGIRTFVASGVPGLNAERVAVLDDRGVVQAAMPALNVDEANALQASLQSVFDTAFGAGATIVRVHALYDAQTSDVHEIRRAPLGGRVVGSTTLDERYSGDRKRYSKTQSQEDRGSDVREEQIRTPAGKLTHLSVAVLADEARKLDIEKLRVIAGATVGLMPKRGDTLSVQELPFVVPTVRQPLPISMILGFATTVLPTLIGVVGGLIALRWGVRPVTQAIESFAQRSAIRRASSEVAGFAPSHVRGVLNGEPPHTAAAIISALPTATATAVLEMYSPEERAAIVRRMQRTAAPVVPDYEALVRRA